MPMRRLILTLSSLFPSRFLSVGRSTWGLDVEGFLINDDLFVHLSRFGGYMDIEIAPLRIEHALLAESREVVVLWGICTVARKEGDR